MNEHNMRWRYGETNCVYVPVLRNTTIHIGDLIYLDYEGFARSAKEFAKKIDSGKNYENMTERFLGVAMSKSNDGELNKIRVATTGDFEFYKVDIDEKIIVGTEISCGWNESSDEFENQCVCPSNNDYETIARCCCNSNEGEDTVQIRIYSQIMRPAIVE